MKKLLKTTKKLSLMLLCMSLFLLATPSKFAYAESNTKNQSSEGFNEYLEMFPDLKKQIDNLGEVNVISDSTKYYKVVKNESHPNNFSVRSFNTNSNTDEEFTCIEMPKKIYEAEVAEANLKDNEKTYDKSINNYNISRANSLGSWSDSDNSGYVKVNIYVAQTVEENGHVFFANQCFAWDRRPFQTSVDAMGIKVSSNLIVKKGTINCGAYCKKTTPEFSSNSINCLSTILEDQSEHGVGAQVSALEGAENFSGYFNCRVVFTEISGNKQWGTINGYYCSNSLTFGSLSISADGMPSIGFEKTTKEFWDGVNVTDTP